eukprot:COSAG06_NODE_50300_length_319_cov_1.768182_1_plen_60_part_01
MLCRAVTVPCVMCCLAASVFSATVYFSFPSRSCTRRCFVCGADTEVVEASLAAMLQHMTG